VSHPSGSTRTGASRSAFAPTMTSTWPGWPFWRRCPPTRPTPTRPCGHERAFLSPMRVPNEASRNRNLATAHIAP